MWDFGHRSPGTFWRTNIGSRAFPEFFGNGYRFGGRTKDGRQPGSKYSARNAGSDVKCVIGIVCRSHGLVDGRYGPLNSHDVAYDYFGAVCLNGTSVEILLLRNYE